MRPSFKMRRPVQRKVATDVTHEPHVSRSKNSPLHKLLSQMQVSFGVPK